jgi:hypothetical protein
VLHSILIPPKAIRFPAAAWQIPETPEWMSGDVSAAVVAFFKKALRLKGFSFQRVIESTDSRE